MSKNKIIGFLLIFLFCNCTEKIKDDTNKENTIITENKEITINLKSITICKSSENEQNNPTFLFNIHLINKTSDKIVFFVQNFGESVYKGGFFLNFVNNNKDIIVELADFSSVNPIVINSNDTIRIMLTSLTDGLTEIKWNETEKIKFIETMKIIYYPEINEIHKDTSLLKHKILKSCVIIASKKTRIFE